MSRQGQSISTPRTLSADAPAFSPSSSHSMPVISPNDGLVSSNNAFIAVDTANVVVPIPRRFEPVSLVRHQPPLPMPQPILIPQASSAAASELSLQPPMMMRQASSEDVFTRSVKDLARILVKYRGDLEETQNPQFYLDHCQIRFNRAQHAYVLSTRSEGRQKGAFNLISFLQSLIANGCLIGLMQEDGTFSGADALDIDAFSISRFADVLATLKAELRTTTAAVNEDGVKESIPVHKLLKNMFIPTEYKTGLSNPDAMQRASYQHANFPVKAKALLKKFKKDPGQFRLCLNTADADAYFILPCTELVQAIIRGSLLAITGHQMEYRVAVKQGDQQALANANRLYAPERLSIVLLDPRVSPVSARHNDATRAESLGARQAVLMPNPKVLNSVSQDSSATKLPRCGA